MKKFLIKLLCFIISLSTMLALVGCKDNNEKGAFGELNSGFNVRYDVNDSSKPLMLAENGATKYKIVYPKVPNKAEALAVEELVYFLQEAFSIEFKVITDENASLDTNNYYISIGETTILKSLDGTDNEVERDFETLKQNGFTIANRGNTVFICSAFSPGTLTGVYDFLEKQVNLDILAYEEILIDKVNSKEIYDYGTFKYTPNAQFVYYSGSITYQYDSVWSYRMRTSPKSGYGGSYINGNILGLFSHTIGHEVLAKSKAENVQYFPDGTHFCLRNNGKNFDDPTGGYYKIASEVCTRIKNGSSQLFYELGMNDDVGKCKCEYCTEYYANHMEAEAYLDLLNYVGRRIREFSKENNINRTCYAMGLMYNLYETPPTKYDEETGKYVPIREDIYMDENAMVRWAPITSCFSHAWDDPNCSHNAKSYIQKIEGWASLTDNLALWTYGKCFQGAGPKLFFPDVSAIDGTADYFDKHNFLFVMIQNEASDKDGTFYELKEYLRRKMYYNSEYDFNALFEKFFEVFYKDAAPAMKEYYKLIMLNFNNISNKKGYGNCIGSYYNTHVYHDIGDWTYEVLINLEKSIKKAYELIENSNQSDEVKSKLRDRVASDAMMYQHFLYADYRAYFSTEEFNVRANTYKKHCEKYGIRNLANV